MTGIHANEYLPAVRGEVVHDVGISEGPLCVH